MKTFMGHRSWNAWNVSLWISNDEPTYQYAMDCIRRARRNLNKATRLFMASFRNSKTPDGATYNALSVKLCLQGFIED